MINTKKIGLWSFSKKNMLLHFINQHFPPALFKTDVRRDLKSIWQLAPTKRESDRLQFSHISHVSNALSE